MARDQDATYKWRENCDEDFQAAAASWSENEWHGKSAQALALVDRAWNSVVMPLVFETIESTGCRDKVFGFHLVPKYGVRFVKRVIFGHDDQEEDWQSLLGALHSFANLEHATFSYDAGVALFEAEAKAEPEGDQAMFREALRRVAPSIRSLQLRYMGAHAIVWMIPSFTNLRRLEWTVSEDEPEGIPDLRPVVYTLAHCSTLEHLSLGEDVESLLAHLAGEDAEPFSWPSLRSLELKDITFFDMDLWKLIQRFEESLEVLSIGVAQGYLAEEIVKKSQTPLPAFSNLRRLQVKASSPFNISRILQLFSLSPLRHLVVSVAGNGIESSSWSSPPSTALLENILRLFPTHLQSIHLKFHLRNTGIHHLHALAPAFTSLASARNISLSLDPSYDVFFHRQKHDADPGTRRERTNRRCDGVDEVLRHTLAQSGRMRATGDLEGAESLVEALTPLRARMLRDQN